MKRLLLAGVLISLSAALPVAAEQPSADELQAQWMIQSGKMQEMIGTLKLQLLATERTLRFLDAEQDAEQDAADAK